MAIPIFRPGPRQARAVDGLPDRPARSEAARGLRDGFLTVSPIRIGRAGHGTTAHPGLVLSGCSTALNLGSNDAGVPYDADCKPGTYSGSYSCTPISGSLLQGVSSNGPIAVTLVPAGAGSLALLDASLSSASTGTTTTSSLSGVLDCSTRKLTGKVGAVVILVADRQWHPQRKWRVRRRLRRRREPARTGQGVLDSPAVLAATCTWTATLE